MKTSQLLFYSLLSGLSLCSRAATLIVPGEQPALTIPAGEAILIDFYQPTGVPSNIQVASQGVTNSLQYFSPTPERPTVLAGPLTIVFPPEYSQVVNYRPLGKVAISTLVVRTGVTNTIEVPSNKTVHFFWTDPAFSSAFYVFLEKGTNSAILF